MNNMNCISRRDTIYRYENKHRHENKHLTHLDVFALKNKSIIPRKSLKYSYIPDSDVLLNLKVRRKEIEDVINYLINNRLSLAPQTIVKRVDSHLAFSFALNSMTNAPIILLKKHRLQEIARNIFSVSFAYDLNSQKLMIFKSGPQEHVDKIELKINKILSRSIYRKQFVVTKHFYQYTASQKTFNLQGVNCKESVRKIGYFLEYQSKGDLTDYITREGLSSLKALNMAKKIAELINVLHVKFSILHNDLKFENILVSKEGNLKLADFGHSKFFGNKMNSFGTKMYAAPELTALWLRLRCQAQHYNIHKTLEVVDPQTIQSFKGVQKPCFAHPSSDVWSFGVILIQLFADINIWQNWIRSTNDHDKFLFSFESIKVKLLKDLYKEFSLKISDNEMVKKLVDLIDKCLNSDPQQRISIQEVLNLLSEIKITCNKPYSKNSLCLDVKNNEYPFYSTPFF